MTLLIGMSKREGLYLSADYRVTNANTGELIDDATCKFLTYTFGPLRNPGDVGPRGPNALLGFTGVAQATDGTPTGTWLRETLRGETDESFDQAMAHLHARLNRDFAPHRLAKHRYQLMVNVLVAHGDKRYFGGFTNLRRPGDAIEFMDTMAYTMQELAGPFVFLNGSGATRAVVDGHLALLQSQLDVKPRDVQDHMKLLATVNRRLASADPTKSVSPFCHVTFIDADPERGSSSRTYTERGETAPAMEMPHILAGVDLYETAKGLTTRFGAQLRGEEPPPGEDLDDVNRRLRRRP